MTSLLKRKNSGCCVAVGCNMRMGTNLLSEVKLFNFPRDTDRRKQWESAVRRENWHATNSSRLCNLHFMTGQPSKDPLHPDYVPSIFSFTTGNHTALDRYARHAKRLKRDVSQPEVSNISDECMQELGQENLVIPKTKECFTMTELTMEDITRLEKQNAGYKSANSMLQNSAKQTTYSKIMGKSDMFSFYTKLPSILLFNTILSYVMDDWEPETKTSLEPAGQQLLVLMKLRLGLLNEDLAYRFDVTKEKVSTLFREWVSRMAFLLSNYIRQPSARTIRRTMPRRFLQSNIGYFSCIVDCSEVFIDRPFNLDARAETYSSYKHHNTIKFLVSFTPAGAISFISRAYGGRFSDKEVTKRSGFLNLLKENDVILADRGFRIEELAAQRNISVILPAFTKGKKQLSPEDIMRSRKISRVRIHVERIIGQMKFYRILKNQMHISYLQDKWVTPAGEFSTADNILKVIACLCNISRHSIIAK